MHWKSRYISLAGLSVLVLVTTFVVASCNIVGSSSSEDMRRIKVMLSTGSENSFSAGSIETMGGYHTDTNEVQLSEVKLLLNELELESVSDDSLDFEVDDMIVNLPLEDDTLELTSQQIPVGLYDALDIEIDTEIVDDADLNDGTDRYSIFVEGTYNGEPFTFRSKREFEEKFKFHPPIEITDSTTTVTLNLSIYLDRWFKFADPTDPADQEKIERNIEKSFNIHSKGDGDKDWKHHDDDDDDDERRDD